MGTSISRPGDIESNEYLDRFANKEHISPNDPFWNRLLSFSFSPPATIAENKRLDERITGLCRRLLVNNLSSGNLGALLHVFLGRAGELLASAQTDKYVEGLNSMFGWQTYNALFILRCISKYLVETVKEEDLVRQFETRPQNQGHGIHIPDEGESRLEVFLDALVELVVDVPVKEFTYPLHVEAVHTLLALLAGPMYSHMPACQSCVYRSLMQGRYAIHAPLLVKTLLQHFAEQLPAPPGLYRPNSGGGSLVMALASGIWSVLTLGLGRSNNSAGDGSSVDGVGPEAGLSEAPLANRSLLLLLVLVNHCTADRNLQNPYRQALFSFTDSQETSREGQPTRAAATFRLDISTLYVALCGAAERAQEEATLLLYLLLHRNNTVRAYVLARTDIERLVEPVLKTLYHAPAAGSHHIYMSLIVLLILSEDDNFNRIVHDTVLKHVPWYTERSISGLSLGGLLVLVVIRTVQFNMLKMRDRYLHTNCLAALANMSAEFRHLHPYVTQRLVSLFESLARKHARLLQQLAQVSSTSSSSGGGGSSSDTDGLQESLPSGASAIDPDVVDELGQDVGVLEEVLRMILEIINSCLSRQLHHNPNLVYTLLHRRRIFLPYRIHPAFQDITHNIDTVLEFFSGELEAAAAAVGGPLGVSEVQAAIQRGATHWPKERLRKFPDLKFKYVEEEQPEDFFIPYVWTLVIRSSGLYWNSTHMKLFPSTSDMAEVTVC